MRDDLLGEFKAQVRVTLNNSKCEECGEGIIVYVKTEEDSEKLVKSLWHVLNKSDHNIYVHTMLANSRAAFYPLALLCFFYLMFNMFHRDYDIGGALVIMTVTWGILMIAQGLALQISRKMDERKRLKMEIQSLTGENK
jgi:hypothetical protein